MGSATPIWIAIAFGAAAWWGVIVLISKRALAYVDPTAMNFAMRLITVVVITAVGVPLSLYNLWELGVGINGSALLVIVLLAVVTSVISLQAYYFALRVGRVAVVAPITATDPLWTAVFAVALVGATLSHATLAGLGLGTVGLVLMVRYMEDGSEPYGDALPSPMVGASSTAQAAPAGGLRGLQVVLLSLVTAACWGLEPVLVELAIEANGSLTVTMLILNNVFGALLLAPLLIVRRRPVFTGVFSVEQRRRAMYLILVAGILEACYEVLLFTLIDEIGSVLIMLILSTTPVWSVAGAMVFLRERPGRKLLLAAAVVLAGVMLATLDSLGG